MKLHTTIGIVYKLKKVFTFNLRSVHNCRGRVKRKGPITVNEIRQVTTAILKTMQCEAFNDAIRNLKSKNTVNKKSKLAKLNVFVDGSNLLRVGGRLKNACLPFETKHQILIPEKYTVTN